MRTKTPTRDQISRVTVFVGILAFCGLMLWDPEYSPDERTQQLWKSVLSRLVGCVVFGGLLVYLRYRVWHRPPRMAWLAVLPALLVAINNAPIMALANGTARIDRFDLIPLFLLDCLLIGVFEELAFRGSLFLAILEKRRSTKKQIVRSTVISSALFALIHVVNLFEGQGVGATLMQVGYSFLIGGMCAIVLLKTQNLLFCILLHTVYDIGGRMLSMLGSGNQWNLPTILLTAALAVAVTVWMLILLFRIDPIEVKCFFEKESTNEYDQN